MSERERIDSILKELLAQHGNLTITGILNRKLGGYILHALWESGGECARCETLESALALIRRPPTPAEEPG